jgi:hypothetical protein
MMMMDKVVWKMEEYTEREVDPASLGVNTLEFHIAFGTFRIIVNPLLHNNQWGIIGHDGRLVMAGEP